MSKVLPERKCRTCLVSMPANEHYFHSRGRGRLSLDCKYCRSKKRKGEKIDPPGAAPSKRIPKAKRYIVTYAQNATPVFEPFLQSLKNYAVKINARVVVIAGRYQNPTSVYSERMANDDWWDPSLDPYIYLGEHEINSGLAVFGDTSIQPTAVRPLSGFETHVRNRSGIFGHPKQELVVIPTASREWPRILMSTGAVTVPNYTQSKAGKKGERSHTIGAAIIEVDGGEFWLRHVTSDEQGCFQDLDSYCSPVGVEPGPPIEALVCGDIHFDSINRAVDEATFSGDGSIVNTMRPRHIVYHDILSMSARPKYDGKKLTTRYKAHVTGKESVRNEVLRVLDGLLCRTPEWSTGHVVQSNHDKHLMHWLETADVKCDPENAVFYHETWLELLRGFNPASKDNWPLPLEVWAKKMLGDEQPLHFLHRDERLRIAGHECDFHGDGGPNGTRGTIGQFAKFGAKTVIGHSHTPGIRDGCMQVGVTGALDQHYNDRPSTWMHAHGILYNSGARTLVFFVGKKWRL